MKSLTKSAAVKSVPAEGHVHLSLPIAGVLRDVRSAFLRLCINNSSRDIPPQFRPRYSLPSYRLP
jgi:hypothetical protein